MKILLTISLTPVSARVFSKWHGKLAIYIPNFNDAGWSCKKLGCLFVLVTFLDNSSPPSQKYPNRGSHDNANKG